AFLLSLDVGHHFASQPVEVYSLAMRIAPAQAREFEQRVHQHSHLFCGIGNYVQVPAALVVQSLRSAMGQEIHKPVNITQRRAQVSTSANAVMVPNTRRRSHSLGIPCNRTSARCSNLRSPWNARSRLSAAWRRQGNESVGSSRLGPLAPAPARLPPP